MAEKMCHGHQLAYRGSERKGPRDRLLVPDHIGVKLESPLREESHDLFHQNLETLRIIGIMHEQGMRNQKDAPADLARQC